MPILDWLNKRQALQAAAAVPYRLIEVDAVHGDPAADNWLIQGDNLLALKALLPFYARPGEVHLHRPALQHPIGLRALRRQARAQPVAVDDAPRLELLRELLAEDGSIWVSIDDNEAHYLKVLMDEVFGRRSAIRGRISIAMCTIM
jgi:adenine-specific DNA-methyltransferase